MTGCGTRIIITATRRTDGTATTTSTATVVTTVVITAVIVADAADVIVATAAVIVATAAAVIVADATDAGAGAVLYRPQATSHVIDNLVGFGILVNLVDQGYCGY